MNALVRPRRDDAEAAFPVGLADQNVVAEFAAVMLRAAAQHAEDHCGGLMPPLEISIAALAVVVEMSAAQPATRSPTKAKAVCEGIAKYLETGIALRRGADRQGRPLQ